MSYKYEEPKKLPLTEIDIRGEKVKVQVDINGRFHASLGGKKFSAGTIDGLRPYLMSASAKKKTKVEIPVFRAKFIYGGGLEFEPLILTGINAATDNITYRTDTGRYDKSKQFSRYDHGDSIYSPISKALQDEGKALYAAHKKAERAWEAFEKTHQIKPREVVLAAIEKATGEKADED